tara:strand:+ start:117 stop:1235 length:1119 start_codon:yes stop_codon:yes gene_type:complete
MPCRICRRDGHNKLTCNSFNEIQKKNDLDESDTEKEFQKCPEDPNNTDDDDSDDNDHDHDDLNELFNEISISDNKSKKTRGTAKKEGGYSLENLKPICSPCNKSIGIENLEEFKSKYSLFIIDFIDGVINKYIIIDRFNEKIRGKSFSNNTNHNGAEGYWLEKEMGIKPNSKNEPDLLGFEQKKNSDKITFGDWRASKYLWEYDKDFTRNEFINTFGSPNPNKNGRYSWSGKVFPKYTLDYNYAGQRIRFLDNENLVIEYSYPSDTREEKIHFKQKVKTKPMPMILAIWEKKKLENHILNKFCVKGFYILKKNKNIYDKICFGQKIDFQLFKRGLENKIIILDSGLNTGTTRLRSSFRADKNFWNQLITEEY